MGFFLAIIVVVTVAILFIFVCSITKFLNQLPNCKPETRDAIDRTVLEMGCFMNFKRNVQMLKNKIEVFTQRIQKLRSELSDEAEYPLLYMVPVQEEAVQLIYEVGQMTNGPWYRMWTGSCYKLSYRVADMILTIERMLNPGAEDIEQPKGDGIPGMVVVFLIAYALTNAILPYLNSTIVYPLKLKKNLQILKNKIHQLEQMKAWAAANLGLLKEGERLSEEAEYLISHWYKGWINGSRYRLCKRMEALISEFKKVVYEPREKTEGYNEIDWIVNEMAYPFKLEKHLQMLKNSLPDLMKLVETYEGDEDLMEDETVIEKVELLVSLQKKSEELSEEAEDMINHKYKGWTGSRYRLTKRIEALVNDIDKVVYSHNVPYGLNTRNAISNIDGISKVLPGAITDIRHYLNFKTNIETLRTQIQRLELLKDTVEKAFKPPHPFRNEEEARKLIAMLEAAIREGRELMKQEEGMDQNWYKRRPGSRYQLSKRVVKLMVNINALTAQPFMARY